MDKKEYNKYLRKHGHPPPRKCKECGVDIDKGKSFCINHNNNGRKYTICGYEGCKEPRTNRKHSCEYHSKENRYKRHMEEIRKCKECGVDVPKKHIYCIVHKGKRKRELGTYYCGFEGCKEPRGYRIRSCEYHSPENRHKRYMEEIVNCSDCGVGMGKRKDWKKHKKKICDDCREIRKKNCKRRKIKYQGKWFKNKYNTDEGFRRRWLEYQMNYTKERWENDKEYRKRMRKYRKDYNRKLEEKKNET